MTKHEDEQMQEEVLNQQEPVQPVMQNQSSSNGFANWVGGLTIARVVAFFCMLSFAFLGLQYLFGAIAYVDVIYKICQVCKFLCLIGAGVAFAFKLLKEKAIKMDGALVMFLATMFICLTML